MITILDQPDAGAVISAAKIRVRMMEQGSRLDVFGEPDAIDAVRALAVERNWSTE